MHPVELNEQEVGLLKQAKAELDWTILPSNKLRYLYQRLVALPMGQTQVVKDIAEARLYE